MSVRLCEQILNIVPVHFARFVLPAAKLFILFAYFSFVVVRAVVLLFFLLYILHTQAPFAPHGVKPSEVAHDWLAQAA